MNESDSPTNDSLVAAFVEGAETDNDCEDDLHYCKKCKKLFTNIQVYLEHKIRHDNYKVTYARSNKDRRMVLPKLVQKRDASACKTEDNVLHDLEGKENKQKKQRRRKKRTEVNIELITERSTYICTTCDKKFNRDATLRWHIKYEHTLNNEERDDDDVEDVLDNEDDLYVAQNPTASRRSRVHADERPFACEVCANRFKDVNVMKAHMLTHSNKRTFVCGFKGCPYAFKTRGSLTRHTRRHTGERPYSCEHCGRSFTESGALTRHMKSRTPCTAKSDSDLPRYRKKWDFIPNIPAVLSQNFPTGSQTISHRDVTTYIDADVTELVKTLVTNVVSIETGENDVIHQELDTVEQIITDITSTEEFAEMECQVCRQDLETVESLRHHLRSHLADMPFRCGLCHFVTEQREDLHTHMASQHNTTLKGLDSGKVVASFTSTNSVIEHRNAQVALRQLSELPSLSPSPEEVGSHVMGYAKAILKCPACFRTFRGTGYLRQHMKSHTGIRPHKCPECPKTFVSKDAMQKHVSSHREDRQYKCGECGKLFKRLAHVREHIKIHSLERPFCCHLCDKMFKTSNARKVHMRTHNDVLPYECRFCARHFREKGSLSRHIRSHTGEKPFKCQHCQRSFSEHGTLNRHLKAKVPCRRIISYTREITSDDADYPTLLAEFSSVVADTQHYLIPEEGVAQEDAEQQQDAIESTEYVVVHTGLGDDIQNVEIITECEVEPSILNQVTAEDGTSYIVVSDGVDSIRLLDPTTGQTMAVMAADSEEAQALTTMTSSDNHIESVAMVPLPEQEQNDAVKQAMMEANVVETAYVIKEEPIE